jgi:putative endonuclease
LQPVSTGSIAVPALSQPACEKKHRWFETPGWIVPCTYLDRVNRTVVYILRSDRDRRRHYTGVTSDVKTRLTWHNAGQNIHTARDRPWSLVVAIEFPTEPAALAFERYLKSGSGRAFAKRHFP